jgi:hypothetical protein
VAAVDPVPVSGESPGQIWIVVAGTVAIIATALLLALRLRRRRV